MPGPYEDDDVEDVYGIFSGGGGADSDAAVEDNVEDVYGIFGSPSKVASSEPMGPPAPPKEWWEDILGNVSDAASWEGGAALLEGASANTADNLVGGLSPSTGAYFDEAAEKQPVMHGIGQALPGTLAAIYAGPGLAAQAAAQGALSGASSAFDGKSFGDVLTDTAIGAGSGAAGQLIGKGVGAVGRFVGDTEAGKWAGRQLGRLMPGADDAARAVPSAAPRRDPFVGRSGELARIPPEPVPVPDEEPIVDLLRRKPAPSADFDMPALPEYPPPIAEPPPFAGDTWPPDYVPPARARGTQGRFAKRPVVDFEPIPTRPAFGPPPAVELPYQSPGSPDLPAPTSPGERLLRMDLPPPPPKPAPLSEPPLPLPPELPRPSAPPLELAFEPGPPPRAKLPMSAPYDVPLREGAKPAAARAQPGLPSDLIDMMSILTPRDAVRGAAAGARIGKRALNALGGPTDTSGLATAGRVATGIGWDTGLPGLFNQKVNAQDYAADMGGGWTPNSPEPEPERTAIADLPTLHYALQATLSTGRTGLSPEDERALTEAVVAGDRSAISATDFRLRQRYPAYARRVELELRGLNEEQE